MKKLFWASTAAAAAMAVTPALAADAPVVYSPPAPSYSQPISAQSFAAHLEGGVGIISFDGESEEFYRLAARGNVPLTSQIGLLVDVNALGAFDVEDTFLPTVSAHLWRRDGNTFYGVFAGATFPPEDAGTIFAVGAEGKYDLGQQLIGAQAAVLFGEGDTAFNINGNFAHYFTPNLKAAANAGVIFGGDADAIWTFGGRIENRFASLPVSAFVSGDVVTFDGETAYAGFLGLRVFFDDSGSTLRSHDEAVPFSYGFTSVF